MGYHRFLQPREKRRLGKRLTRVLADPRDDNGYVHSMYVRGRSTSQVIPCRNGPFVPSRRGWGLAPNK